MKLLKDIIGFIFIYVGIYLIAYAVKLDGSQFWLIFGAGMLLAAGLLIFRQNTGGK